MIRRFCSPVLGLIALFAVGCSSTFAMTPDSTVPFAAGEVDVGAAENGNTDFTVRVEHLGDPGKLDASATTYVVWIKPAKEDAQPTNVGAMQVDSHQTGKLRFSTAFKEFDVTVTPEAAADATKPSGRNVLKSSVSVP